MPKGGSDVGLGAPMGAQVPKYWSPQMCASPWRQTAWYIVFSRVCLFIRYDVRYHGNVYQ